jgi:hypothetical protein
MFGLPVSFASYGGGEYSENYGIDCSSSRAICQETAYKGVLWPGKYVGHDEPGVAFFSNQPGSGNRMEYHFTLPHDASPASPLGKSYNFELTPAFWFGMIVCDTQSYPEQVSTCRPDSDSNITALRKYPGSAYMEMQFYPPGWVELPAGISCSARKWCAALNIDSLSMNPLNNTSLNDSCSNSVGQEYVNFAFITKSGRAQAPANPIAGTAATYTPDPKTDLFMSSGDQIDLKMFDTAHGLRIVVRDLRTHRSGSMTASKANGFAQVLFAPNPSVACTAIPYDFHPMYSTSTTKTILPWGATQQNVEFVLETGHFDWCHGGSTPIKFLGSCPSDGYEGPSQNRASDYDDTFCFRGKDSLLVRVGGCEGQNVPGYDGAPYVPDWPDGTTIHPGPTTFSSPHSGATFSESYQHAAFVTDLPAIEPAIQCDVNTGAGCSHFPLTDFGTPASFYPFFSTIPKGSSCVWNVGTDIPRLTTDNYGRNDQYGPIQPTTFLKPGGHGKTYIQYTGYLGMLSTDPCA